MSNSKLFMSGMQHLAIELGVSLGEKSQEEIYEFYTVDRMTRKAAKRISELNEDNETLRGCLVEVRALVRPIIQNSEAIIQNSKYILEEATPTKKADPNE